MTMRVPEDMGLAPHPETRRRLTAIAPRPGWLAWFEHLAGAGALDLLPEEALLLPGDRLTTIETVLDLATGEPVPLLTIVPPGHLYARLSALQPFLQRRAGNAYYGEAGLSGTGTILHGAADAGSPVGSTNPSTGTGSL
jgi:hypothetical protein